jgi:hypothetical protein
VIAQLGGGNFLEFKHDNKFLVDKIEMHNVNPYTLDNDLAILTLNNSLNDTQNYQALELPNQNPIDENDCYIFGYGSKRMFGKVTRKLYFGKVSS